MNTKKNTSVFKKINTRTFEYKDGKTCIQKRINLEKMIQTFPLKALQIDFFIQLKN